MVDWPANNGPLEEPQEIGDLGSKAKTFVSLPRTVENVEDECDQVLKLIDTLVSRFNWASLTQEQQDMVKDFRDAVLLYRETETPETTARPLIPHQIAINLAKRPRVKKWLLEHHWKKAPQS